MIEARRQDTLKIGKSHPAIYLAVIALSLCGFAPCASATERVWSKQFDLPPDGHVSIINVQGSVVVEGWDRSEVEATVAMRSKGASAQLNDVQVAVEKRDQGIEFHTLYPQGNDSPVQVDYRLRVPRQIHLDQLSTLRGDIVVHDIDGSMEAHNLHGDIAGVDVSGSIVAHALTGNIMMSLRAMPDRHLPLQLVTVNGNVDLVLPAQANANLDLSTVSGNVVSSFPFQVSSTPGDSTRHAQVGDGGVQVELKTVRGNIRVSQRDRDL